MIFQVIRNWCKILQADCMNSTSIIKFLVMSTGLPRRALADAILDKQVTINGKYCSSITQSVDPTKDVVRLKGRILKPQPPGVLLFYKPSRVVTTKSDPQGRKTVMDYVPKEFRYYDPVGRLDYWSTGLLVLTNDGDLAYRLTHPKYKVPKVYRVKVAGVLEPRDVRKLLTGLYINQKRIKFEKVEILESRNDHTVVKVELFSGENRVIRKVFEKIYHPVLKLHREKLGPLTLKDMKPGEIRKLSDAQYKKLRELLFREESDKKTQK